MRENISPNKSKSDMQKVGVVLHSTLGAFNGAESWLTSPISNVSAQYLVGRNRGESVRLVPNEDMAWHAGVVSNPSDRFLKIAKKGGYRADGFINPNLYLIGIEFATGYDMDGDGVVEPEERLLNEWQYEEGIRIIKEEIGFELEEIYLITHRDIASYKPDMDSILDEFKYRLFGQNPVDNEAELIAKLKAVILLIQELLKRGHKFS